VTYTEAVEEYFRSRPAVWINGMTLACVGGSYAWRSRVSDCRRRRGMKIENRQRRVTSDGQIVSEYRFVLDSERE